MKIRMKFVLLTIFVLGLIPFIILLSSCEQPLSPDIPSDVNPTLLNHLNYIENLALESEWLREQGNNSWSGWMNVLIAVETALGASVTVVAATSIWGTHIKTKAVTSFVISIALILVSAGVYLVKAENERYYQENRNQYIALSQKINNIITEFTIEFQYLGITSENFESHRQEFLDLATGTYRSINDVKMEYFEKYGLEVNSP